MPYENPEIKTVVYPENPASILTALNKAKNKTFEDRDQRPLTSLLERAVEVNPRLAGHLLTRKTAVSSFGWSLVNGDDNKRELAELRLKKAIDYIVDNFQFLAAFGRIGFKVAEWLETPNGWTPKLEFIDTIELDGFKGEFGVWQDDVKTKLELNDLFLGATADGYLKTTLYAELFRFGALQEQANFIMKLKGILQIIDRGAGDSDRAIAIQAANQAVKNNFFVSDEFIDLKLNQIVASSGQAFKDAIEGHNADISIGALGQANTSELPNSGGSRAAVQILQKVSAVIHYSDIVTLENFINEQLIKHDVIRNYGIDAVPEWTFKIDISEEFNFIETAGAVCELKAAGLPMVKKEVYKILNLTEPQEGDDVFEGGF